MVSTPLLFLLCVHSGIGVAFLIFPQAEGGQWESLKGLSVTRLWLCISSTFHFLSFALYTLTKGMRVQ